MKKFNKYLKHIVKVGGEGISKEQVVELAQVLLEIESIHLKSNEEFMGVHFCNTCAQEWPCNTQRAIDVALPESLGEEAEREFNKAMRRKHQGDILMHRAYSLEALREAMK